MLRTAIHRAHSAFAAKEYGVPPPASTRGFRSAPRLNQALERVTNAGRAAVSRAKPAQTLPHDRRAPSQVLSRLKRAVTYVFNAGARVVGRGHRDASAQRHRTTPPVVARTYKAATAQPLCSVSVGASAGSGVHGVSGAPDGLQTSAPFPRKPTRIFIERPAPLPVKTGERRSTHHDDVVGKIDMRHRPLPLTPTQIAFEQMVQPLREAYDKAQAQHASTRYANVEPTYAPRLSVKPTPAPRLSVKPTPAPRSSVKPTPAPRLSVKPTPAPRLNVKPYSN